MSREKILIVDDDENVLKSLVRLFQEDNYAIFTACDGIEGLALVKKHLFHIVISDYRMPKMNGIEFLKNVKRIASSTIRIILTVYADIDIAIAAINEGHVYKFLLKPWDEELLKIEIKKSLDHFDLVQQQKELQEELGQKNKMLENMNKNLEKLVEERTQQLIHSEKMATLGQLAAQIGHEINNVLTILKGRTELLEYNKTDAEYIDNTIKIFMREIDSLTIQARNLLTIGKPAPPDFKNLDLKTILEKTLDNLLSVGVLKYYNLEKEYQEKLPLIYGNPSQVDQVFTNLLINAHHAMEKMGDLKVGIKILNDTNYIETYITDTGKGISEENINKIFGPFFTTKPQGKGTGLGLPVVKKIMDEHNGYINVDSKINVGTTMTLGFLILQNNDV